MQLSPNQVVLLTVFFHPPLLKGQVLEFEVKVGGCLAAPGVGTEEVGNQAGQDPAGPATLRLLSGLQGLSRDVLQASSMSLPMLLTNR